MSFITEELETCDNWLVQLFYAVIYHFNAYDSITKYNRKFKLNLSFDVVLMVQDLFKEDLTDLEKMDTALKIFVVNQKKLKRLTVQQKSDLLTDIFNERIKIKSKHTSSNNKKVFDFNEDAEYIYSSFAFDYGIDLIEMQGKLHWKKFIALFQGLSANTKIKEIMSIRGRKLPKATKYNSEEIENLLELKSYYALEDTGMSYQDGLNKLFGTLEKMALRNE